MDNGVSIVGTEVEDHDRVGLEGFITRGACFGNGHVLDNSEISPDGIGQAKYCQIGPDKTRGLFHGPDRPGTTTPCVAIPDTNENLVRTHL